MEALLPHSVPTLKFVVVKSIDEKVGRFFLLMPVVRTHRASSLIMEIISNHISKINDII
jgi:hypothetical protein